MKHKIPIITVITIILNLLFNLPAYSMSIAKITFMQGTAYVGEAEDGPWIELAVGMSVSQGQLIKTGKTGIVEMTLTDKSVIRLASKTLYQFDETISLEEKRRKFSARLFFGKLWARVSKTVGVNSGSFDITTPTAVVGVRGTVYNIYAALDRSTLVSVYQGLVGVGPPIISKGAKKEEISWPTEVTEKKWEEIILKRLQRLFIGSDGIPGKLEPFDPLKEKDEWADWNLKKDATQTGTQIIKK